LADKIEKIVVVLDDMDDGYQSIHSKLTDLAIEDEGDEDLIKDLPDMGLPRRSLMKSQVQKSFRKKQLKRTSIMAQNIC
jgi:hypothetical protein